TLFSTHYHELTDMDSFSGVGSYTVSVKEKDDEIIFLRKVIPGKVDRSYGIQVARLAGLPEKVLRRAGEVMRELEKRGENPGSGVAAEIPARPDGMEQWPKCAECGEKAFAEELFQLDIDRITPVDALNMLARWKEKIVRQGYAPDNKKQDI
ncbi:MAG: DNA mismatch repair protein MutS, partial [Firmicutes bacterium]|nr:DNA mismatch repair protein MutS [Bacillota bacterium]